MIYSIQSSARIGALLGIHTSDDLIAPPLVEPLDIEEVKKQLRFSPTSEDTLLDLWIAAARQIFEERTGRQLIAATWERRLQYFPSGVIELGHPPLLEVLSVRYVDSDGTEQTIVVDDDYVVEAPTGPYARPGIVRNVNDWPTPRGYIGDVRVRYRAGYGENIGAVPELVRAVLLMMVSYFHKFRSTAVETRESITSVPLGFNEILLPFKYSALPVYPPQRPWTSLTSWP